MPVGIALSGGVDSTGLECIAGAMLNDGTMTRRRPLRFSTNLRSDGFVRPRIILRRIAHGDGLPRHFWRLLGLELWMRTFNLEMS